MIAAIALIFGLLVSPSAAEPADAVFPRGLPWALYEGQCEGAKRCVWDAKHQGNGEGQSMILTRFDGSYLAAPISHRRAHRLQAAWCERENVACGYAD